MSGSSRLRPLWGAFFLLCFYALALPAVRQKSPTMDEQGFLVRGLGVIRGENQHMRVGHPIGLNVWNALLLAHDARVRLPTTDPSWTESSFHRPAELFLWEIGNDVAHILFLGRLPTVWLGLWLIALVGRFAAEATSHAPWAAPLAMGVLAFDPNILAHGTLATTDLGLAAGTLLATYTLWRAVRRPQGINFVLAGVGLGLLLNTKFTAGLVLLCLGVLALIGIGRAWRAGGRFPLRLALGLGLIYPLTAFFTLWASYSFQVGTLPAQLPSFSALLGGRTLPLAAYIEQLSDLGGRMQKATPAFLLGRYSDEGWWYYFPVALALKTPWPTWLLFIGALARPVRRWRRWEGAALGLVPAGYLAFSLTSGINIGYRHVLLLLPFVALIIAYRLAPAAAPAGTQGAPASGRHRWLPGLPLTLLVLWLALDTLRLAPHYLAYFNPLAGGPDDGWRALVDSNLDWGQDLAGLKTWLDEQGVDHIWLSYFGEGRPEYYGISYTGLPSFPPRLMPPEAQPTSLRRPAPGLYAISATNLQGVLFEDHDRLAWFRTQTPIAKIGYSIFLYEVPAEGAPTALALGGLQIDDLDETAWEQWDSNDLTLSWFDPTQSLLLPGAPRAWLALATDIPFSHRLQTQLLDSCCTVATSTPPYTLYQRQTERQLPAGLSLESALEQPLTFHQEEGSITLQEATYQYNLDELWVISHWHALGQPRPVHIFLHLTAPDGRMVAQWDGLGAVWQGWRAGDALWQFSRLVWPADVAPGRYSLWVGLYHPTTGERWQSPAGDRIFLGEASWP